MTTEQQLQANWQNAQESTGPATPEGKAVAKMNALKHCILAREVVIRGEHIKESAKEFHAILARFWQELAPAGPVEEMLVERLVVCYWRLRRVLIAESGAIRLSVDTGSWQRLIAECNELTRMKQHTFIYKESDFRQSALGIQYLLGKLEEIREWVDEVGELTEDIFQRVIEVFGDEDDGVARVLGIYRLVLQDNPEGLEPDALKAKHKQLVLTFLDEQRERLKQLHEVLGEQEGQEQANRSAASFLPSKETVEKLLRYETTIERQLYRALNQLERLQRQRKGEVIPPPIAVDVSTQA